MTLWIKVDVDFFDHRKTAKAGVPAAFLFLKMVAYAKKFAPDGLVPKEVDLGRLATKANLDALVAVGFLHDAGSDWQIHDYAVWQTSTAQVSAKRSAAGAKGAAKRWQGHSKPNGNCHPDPEAPS